MAYADLNQRQRAFIDAITSGPTRGNGKQSAIAAGYSAKTAEITASKLLRVPKVREARREKLERTEADADFTREDALRKLIAIAEEGASDRIPALKLMGQWQGWEAAKKHEVDATVKTVDDALAERAPADDFKRVR